jgi:hypothetical protein
MNKYARLFERAVQSVDYWTQISIRDFIGDVVSRMEQRGLKRADIASAIGASPSYVTKALRGDANFSLETMNKFALAVGGRVKVGIVDQTKSIADAVPVSSGLYFSNQTRRTENTVVEMSQRNAANEWEMGIRLVRNSPSATLLRKVA